MDVQSTNLIVILWMLYKIAKMIWDCDAFQENGRNLYKKNTWQINILQLFYLLFYLTINRMPGMSYNI